MKKSKQDCSKLLQYQHVSCPLYTRCLHTHTHTHTHACVHAHTQNTISISLFVVICYIIIIMMTIRLEIINQLIVYLTHEIYVF